MLRPSRPALAETASWLTGQPRRGGNAAAATAAEAAAPLSSHSHRPSRQRVTRESLTRRYNVPINRLRPNPLYSNLLIGQHYDKLIVDRRAQLMALLAACNLIRETIAGQGRILLTSSDKGLEGELMAAAAESGEFVHAGKWMPGGFTNRPQVQIVPVLPSLVICFEADSHVLLREAFQKMIPRIAPVNAYNHKSDATPEIPIHATEFTLIEKKRMLHFFVSFIAKLKFGQMPEHDNSPRFKEYANHFLKTLSENQEDIPEPYLRSFQRSYDDRPDRKFGVHPKHVVYNEKRAFEESALYKIRALQSPSYVDPQAPLEASPSYQALEEDYDPGILMEDDLAGSHSTPPEADMWGTTMVGPDGKPLGDQQYFKPIKEDYEALEMDAIRKAARGAGVSAQQALYPPKHESADEIERADRERQALMENSSPHQVQHLFEEEFQARQDHANDFAPYRKNDGSPTSTDPFHAQWSVPGEEQTQQRLWRLQQRVKRQRTSNLSPIEQRQEELDKRREKRKNLLRKETAQRIKRDERAAGAVAGVEFMVDAIQDYPAAYMDEPNDPAYFQRNQEAALKRIEKKTPQQVLFDENDQTEFQKDPNAFAGKVMKGQWRIARKSTASGAAGAAGAAASGSGPASGSGSKGPGTGTRSFSTYTGAAAAARRMSTPVFMPTSFAMLEAHRANMMTASNASASPSPSSASSSSSPPPPPSGQQRPKFSFPKFLYPFFLLLPPVAYWAALRHEDDESRARIVEENKEFWNAMVGESRP